MAMVPVIGYPNFNTGVPQLSDAVGATNAAEGFGGLQPRSGILEMPVATGFIWSLVHEMVPMH
jgi:hypothetical protein